MLGYLVGLLTWMHTDEDYAAWHRLKKIVEIVTALEERVDELVAAVEIAKKRCMADILQQTGLISWGGGRRLCIDGAGEW